MKIIDGLFLILILGVVSIATPAQGSDLKIPAAVKPFVEKGKTAIAIESADLNGDGMMDYVLVVESTKAAAGDTDDDKRTLLILVSDPDGKLKLVKSNDKVVYCRSCGGVFGDPFAGIRVKRNSFTV